MHAPLLALLQVTSDASPDSLPLGAMAIVVLLALVFGLIALFVSRFKRCPANQVLVISGKVKGDKSARVISGGGAFVWPVIQEFAYMDLTPIQIQVPLKDALSAENIRLAVPSVFTVAIGQDEESQQNAAARLLAIADDEEAISKVAQDIIFGVMRAVVAGMTIEEINRDRDALLSKIQEHLSPELRKIGLVLINVNIHDLRDESGYIEAIGRKAASQAVQQARGDVADQEKMGEVRVASANREQQVAVAEAQKDREIGLAQAQQAQRIAVAAADAKAQAGEASSKAEIAKVQATLAVTQAEAMQQAETARALAQAEVERRRAEAQTAVARAHAEQVEASRRAELEAPAKAEKARMIVEAEANAERIRLAAQADAEATKIKLLAQAEGEAEILRRRNAAVVELIDKAGSAQGAFQLMMVEKIPEIAKYASEAIQNIKFDKVVVWDSGAGTAGAPGGAAGFVRSMASALPPAMAMLGDIGGVQLPAFLGTMTDEAKAEQHDDRPPSPTARS